MSTVEIAVRKVKGLSEKQAKDLLNWMSKLQPRPRVRRPAARVARRKRKARQSMRELMAWYDSIRGTTDWEPPRMPPDLVHRVTL